MDNPIMSPPLKKLKIFQSRTIFKHIKDEEKCMQITQAIDAALSFRDDDFKIPQILIQEISQFATGFLIKCPDKCCGGYIHYLYGNNFQENTYDQLYNYTCDNAKCDKINHVFHCSWPDCRCICIKKIDSDVCKYLPQCNNAYCRRHKHTAMYKCLICDKYICNGCIEQMMRNKSTDWVNTTCIDNDEKLFFCWDCDHLKQSPLTEDTTD